MTSSCETKSAKRSFSRIGLAMSVILLIASGLQYLWFSLPDLFGVGERLLDSPWGKWLGTFVPIYVIAIPLGLLLLRKLPACAPEDGKLRAKNFLFIIPICFFMMYAGNLVGTVLSLILSGGSAENAVLDYAMDSHPLKILVMVILAPILEEYVCRKQLIDRTRKYGEKTAVVLSGVVFALLHQNFFQFFYAFGLGVVFAYIYTRTGRLRYTILLHAVINFTGAVIAPWILSLIDLEAISSLDAAALSSEELVSTLLPMIPGLVVYMLYAMLLMGLAVTGLVFMIVKRRRLVWNPADEQLPKGTVVRTVYLNFGMILYIVLCVVSFILALL